MINKKIKFQKIKNNKFIIIPKPLRKELLSSWIVRTSYAHHLHPHTFMRLYFEYNDFTNNLDTCLSNEFLMRIKQKSGGIDTYDLSLQSLSGYLQENIISNGLNKLVCPQRFCPICLRYDKIIYFRKSWKILFNTVCLKHKCYLYDCCPKCNKKLDITKMYKNKKPFQYCHNCGFDLSKSRKIPLDEGCLKYIKYLKELNKTLKKGYIVFDNYIVYSFLFYDALFQFAKKILKHENTNFIKNRYLYKYLAFKKYSSSTPVYHQITIREQFALISLSYFLFKDYPRNLKKFILKNKLSHWSTLKDMEYISFWFENIINSIMPRKIYRSKILTKTEIENGKKYLKKNKLIVNKANLSRLFGCNFFSQYNNLEVGEN